MPDELTDRLVRWEEAWEQGDDLPAAALCPDRPDLAVPLQRRIDRLKAMAWMALDGNEDPTGGPAADPLVGTVLAGRYRIDRFIAGGGFGRVYRGYDLELHRAVAVKVARPEPDRADGQADLLAEARRAAKLRHPGLVAVHDVGVHDGRVFVVSDLIDGRSLAEVVAAGRPPPAAALDHAHRTGFVHRDIKPQNILIDPAGRPLVTDFGLAADAGQIARGAGAASGTLPYMAPEQVAGEVQLVGPRTDVYALGVVLYELLAGRHPHPARTPAALWEQVLFRPPSRSGR